MAQTAVEWLVEKLTPMNWTKEYMQEYYKDAINQAKEMEKQQIIKAYDLGSLSEMQYPDPKTVIENGEQYYNKTFKSE
jgi:hypothetical protein